MAFAIISTITLVVLSVAWFLERNKRIAAKLALVEVQKIFKRQRLQVVDLELATAKQIVNELARRPNIRFILMLPHGDNEDPNLHVEIHSSNISPSMALSMLKATYQGVMDTIKGDDAEDDYDNSI